MAQLKYVAQELVNISTLDDSLTKQITHSAERSALKSVLTGYPLFSTLLFIESIADRQEKNWWLWLLLRIQHCIGSLSYEHCLAFDNARRNFTSTPTLELDRLINGSNLEIAQFCLSAPLLHQFGHHFTKPPKKRTNKQSVLPYQSDNEYLQTISVSANVDVEIFTPVEALLLNSEIRHSCPIVLDC